MNGFRGNWSTVRGQWSNPYILVPHQQSLENYNSADGLNQGDTQELEPAFYRDLEDCHIAQFSAHGGQSTAGRR